MQVKDQQRNIGDSSTSGFVNGPQGQMNVTAWNNQHNNVNKTHEIWPMPGGTQIFNGSENIRNPKNDQDRVNTRLPCSDLMIPPPSSYADTVPSLDSYAKINMPQQYNENINTQRIDGNILQAFKSNPYTQSLQSY